MLKINREVFQHSHRFKTLYGAEATGQQKRYEELSAYFAEVRGC